MHVPEPVLQTKQNVIKALQHVRFSLSWSLRHEAAQLKYNVSFIYLVRDRTPVTGELVVWLPLPTEPGSLLRGGLQYVVRFVPLLPPAIADTPTLHRCQLCVWLDFSPYPGTCCTLKLQTLKSHADNPVFMQPLLSIGSLGFKNVDIWRTKEKRNPVKTQDLKAASSFCQSFAVCQLLVNKSLGITLLVALKYYFINQTVIVY